jgi:hypothetical protein
MLGNAHFYNRTIRKVVVAFGTMFNDILLQRYSVDGTTKQELFKVPLTYGSKEKYITRITSDPNLTKTISSTVPRISFEMTGMSYDSGRKQVSTLQNFSANTATGIKTQFAPIPYNFDFSMSIFVRNTEDGTQILEQILPFFTPDFNVTVDFIAPMDQKYDMPVILNSVSNQVDYEGDFMSTRLIIWNLEFTAKGYIWPPVKSGKIIRQANTSIYIESQTRNSQKVFVDKANGSGYFAQEETIFVDKRGVTGDVSYFSNSNTGILVVSNLNKLLEANDVVVGATTNASYTVTSVDTNPLRAVLVITTPDPITANVDDEFGFSETISEWPNT